MSDKNKPKKKNDHWPLRVFFMAVILSALLSFFSSTALNGAGYVVAGLVLAAFIALGIVFDMIGVAVTAADPKPFHSMAAHKEKGGKEAIRLLSNANRVSSVCNDVVGDIVGVISGSAGSGIALYLAAMGLPTAVASVLIAAFTSAFMIGGKAAGKSIAIEQSANIVLFVGKTMALFERKTTKRKKNKKN